eukprot:257708-Pyramimonas_sp.AAC.1
MARTSGPASMGGDWNMTPFDLEQSELTQRADVVTAVPGHATFRGGTGMSTVDSCSRNITMTRGYREGSDVLAQASSSTSTTQHGEQRKLPAVPPPAPPTEPIDWALHRALAERTVEIAQDPSSD